MGTGSGWGDFLAETAETGLLGAFGEIGRREARRTVHAAQMVFNKG